MTLKLASSMHGHANPEPLGLAYIGAALQSAGLSCHLVDRLELRVALDTQHEIALLTCTTADYALAAHRSLLLRKEGIPSLVGGYHVCGRRSLSGLSNSVCGVIGEGERIVPKLLANLSPVRNSESTTRIEIKSGEMITAPPVTDLDSLPFPLRFHERLRKYKIYDLMWPPANGQHNAALVLASRGCVHNCDFCASRTVWGNGVRFRSVSNVVAELEDLSRRFGTNTIVFIDQSLGQAKSWTLDLCRTIENARLGMNWYHQSNLTIDREVLRAMAAAGCTKIGFGLEGISPRSIERFKPHNPHDLECVNDLFDYCNSLGLFVKAYLMIGSPWETEQDIVEYHEHIQNIRANEIKISYFTPFPGTRIWDQYRNQLVTEDWSMFDTVAMPVVHNPRISVQQYHAIRASLFQTFYGSNTYFNVTAQMLRRFPHYVQSYREFVDYLLAFDMITGNEPWLDLLGLDREFVTLASSTTTAREVSCS